MTTNDLAAIRARAEAATRGPWVTRSLTELYDGKYDGPPGSNLWLATEWQGAKGPNLGADEMLNHDAVFVAHARTDIPNLCDEVEFLRGIVNTPMPEHTGRLAGRASREEIQRVVMYAKIASTSAERLTILHFDLPRIARDYLDVVEENEALRGELARAREALGAAIPLLQTHSCWHDVFPELDCCEYGLVAEQASVALGNEPLPIYAEHMAAMRDAGRGEGE